jgi:hypothetical protein
MPQDRFQQYAEAGGYPSPEEIKRRIASQYTLDTPKITTGDYSYEAPGRRPPATPRHPAWAPPSEGVHTTGGGAAPTPLAPRQRPRVDFTELFPPTRNPKAHIRAGAQISMTPPPPR